MATALHIRHAEAQDIPLVDDMLRALSVDLGDRHRADNRELASAGFGEHPAFHAQIALDNDGQGVGIALYSPVFSTVLGSAGLYLSDLWVATTARGHGLGQQLIAAALCDATQRWHAHYVKLAVYDDNPRALAFYERLGFRDRSDGEQTLILSGDALDAMRKRHSDKA